MYIKKRIGQNTNHPNEITKIIIYYNIGSEFHNHLTSVQKQDHKFFQVRLIHFKALAEDMIVQIHQIVGILISAF